MRPIINDCARWILGRILLFWGGFSVLITKLRVARHHSRCRALKESLGITHETPILTHGPELQAHIEAAANDDCLWAQTSGSSGTPKRIPYPKHRITSLRLSFMAAFVRCFWALRVKRTVFYAFAGPGRCSDVRSVLQSLCDKTDILLE